MLSGTESMSVSSAARIKKDKGEGESGEAAAATAKP